MNRTERIRALTAEPRYQQVFFAVCNFSIDLAEKAQTQFDNDIHYPAQRLGQRLFIATTSNDSQTSFNIYKIFQTSEETYPFEETGNTRVVAISKTQTEKRHSKKWLNDDAIWDDPKWLEYMATLEAEISAAVAKINSVKKSYQLKFQMTYPLSVMDRTDDSLTQAGGPQLHPEAGYRQGLEDIDAATIQKAVSTDDPMTIEEILTNILQNLDITLGETPGAPGL